MKDFIDLVLELYEENETAALLVIAITVVAGGFQINSLNREIAKLKEKNSDLEQKTKDFDRYLEREDSIRREIARLKNQLEDSQALGEKTTKDKEAIENFLKKLTQLERGMTEHSERINEAKRLSENIEAWTEQTIQAGSKNKRPSWKKRLSSIFRSIFR